MKFDKTKKKKTNKKWKKDDIRLSTNYGRDYDMKSFAIFYTFPCSFSIQRILQNMLCVPP